jgi:tetratricopeptide (TPR) repeat protein
MRCIILFIVFSFLYTSCSSTAPKTTGEHIKERAYAIFLQARSYEFQGNIDAAYAGYEEVYRLDPEANAVKTLLLNYYLDRNNIAKALPIAEDIFNDDTTVVTAGQLYSRLLYQMKKVKEAKDIVNRIRHYLKADDYANIEFDGLLAEETGDTLSAINAWKKLIENPRSRITALNRLLSLNIDIDSISYAYEIARRLVKENEYSQSTRLSILRLADNQNYYDSVICLLDTLKKNASNDVALQVQNDKAFLLLRLGKFDEAETEYRQLGDVRTLGLFLFARGKLPEAESLLIAIDTVDSDVSIAVLLGRIRLALGKYDSAIVVFKRILSVNSQNPEVFYYLGSAYEAQSKYDSSVSYFSKSFFLDTNNLDCLFRLAASSERSGKFRTAETLMTQVVIKAPLFHLAQNYLAYMYAEKGENLLKAESLVLNALKLDSANGAYMDTYGWILYKKGKAHLTEAISWLEKALEKSDGNDIEIFEHLAAVHKAMGNTEKSEDFIKKAEEMKNAH